MKRRTKAENPHDLEWRAELATERRTIRATEPKIYRV